MNQRTTVSPTGDEVKKAPPASAAEPSDEAYMRRCLALAAEAAGQDEVPVGALVVCRGEVVGQAANTRETSRCATHHAEILAIEEACRAVGGWRLPDSTLYVTMEPCPMCAGAAVNARIGRVVWGTDDPKAGAFGSVVDLTALPLNHKPRLTGGVLAEECRDLLTSYFQNKRKKEKPPSFSGQ